MDYFKIQRIIDKNNFSKIQVCKAAGITRPTLDAIINKKRKTNIDTLESIAKALGVSPVIFWTDETSNVAAEPDVKYGCSHCADKERLIKILEKDNEALRSCIEKQINQKKQTG